MASAACAGLQTGSKGAPDKAGQAASQADDPDQWARPLTEAGLADAAAAEGGGRARDDAIRSSRGRPRGRAWFIPGPECKYFLPEGARQTGRVAT